MSLSASNRAIGSRAARFLVIGSINMDTLLETEATPATDGAVLVTNSYQMPGGHAANCASALAAMGADVGLIGAVGRDENGRALTADLHARGIDIEGLQTLDDHPTGEVIIPTRGADHFMFVLRGANDHASTDVVRAVHSFRPDGLIVFDPSKAIFERIRYLSSSDQCEVPIFWVPGGINCDDPNLTFMFDLSEVVIVNAVERDAVLRHAPADFIENGKCEFVTTLGADGARVQCGAVDITREMSVANIRIADSIGAGDAFAAAYILSRQLGAPMEARLVIANSAGTAAVGTRGARAGIEELADAMGAHE